ncbi:hypothetical protein JW980_01050 [Acinetobacter johnsonii]|uniref:hypothetical protein n=1 Tax=Acinetobacter johnsonii TaxID=40214 RepID=UPI00196A72E7|nr:hypothetical protein [Acinetobacter johnsonii]QSE46067.1 hypothetical protein JW980_01050 [Acinetobacter johnsonii]
MQHPVDFEERFVIDILKKINGLKPEDVIPQYHFTDFDGGNRYIDFCIKNAEKGYFLSIELDGRFKFQNDLLEKTLERQNALVANVGTLVRYANTTWLNNPNRVINEIQTILYKQKIKHMNDAESRKQIQKSLSDYQKELLEVKELSIKNNHEQELKKLNSAIMALKAQMAEKKEAPNEVGTTDELKNIAQMMKGLSQQIDELKAKSKEDINPESKQDKEVSATNLQWPEQVLNTSPELIVTSNKSVGIKHIHMALLGLIVIFIVGITTYILKNEKSSDIKYTDSKDTVSKIVDSEPSFNKISNESPNIDPLVNDSPQIEVEQVTAQEQNIESHTEDSSFIHASDASKYIGEYRKVCGQVVQIKEFSKGIYLNFGNNYPRQNLTAVVWSSDISNFGNLNQYVGNSICISGEITSYRGTPQIELSSLEQVN